MTLEDIEEKENQKFDLAVFKSLFKAMLRQKSALVRGLLLLAAASFAGLVEPRVFGYAVDEAIIPKDWERLKFFVGILLGVVCVRVIGAIGQAYFFEALGQRVAQDLRCRLYEHLMSQPVAVFDKNPVGRLMTRVTNDVSSISEMFSAGFVAVLGNVIMITGIVIWLFVLHAKLAALSLAVFPLLLWISTVFSKRLRVAYREARSRLSAVNTFLAENIMGMKTVLLFNRSRAHFSKFKEINERYAEAQYASVKVFALFHPAITVASGIAICFVIWKGGEFSLEGEVPPGILVAYFSYILALFQPIREVADKWNIFLSGMASAERVFAVLSWKPEPGASLVAQGRHAGSPQVEGTIEFENVWFSYQTTQTAEAPDNWVLREFNFKIKAGEKVAFVGHTGAGKTTIISLLMRFYEPQRGRILLDGRDIRELEPRRLRSFFGMIQQDGYLFSGSIEDNMTFWEPERNYQAILQEVGIDLAAYGLGKNELRERASNISSGQKQLLAFCRAIVSNPSIWILDEATAQMDSSTELSLHRALEQAARGKTTVIVAHRLSTIQACDRIVVMNKGSLIEQGSHDRLLEEKGLYYRLYQYQKSKERYESQTV